MGVSPLTGHETRLLSCRLTLSRQEIQYALFWERLGFVPVQNFWPRVLADASCCFRYGSLRFRTGLTAGDIKFGILNLHNVILGLLVITADISVWTRDIRCPSVSILEFSVINGDCATSRFDLWPLFCQLRVLNNSRFLFRSFFWCRVPLSVSLDIL